MSQLETMVAVVETLKRVGVRASVAGTAAFPHVRAVNGDTTWNFGLVSETDPCWGFDRVRHGDIASGYLRCDPDPGSVAAAVLKLLRGRT